MMEEMVQDCMGMDYGSDHEASSSKESANQKYMREQREKYEAFINAQKEEESGLDKRLA